MYIHNLGLRGLVILLGAFFAAASLQAAIISDDFESYTPNVGGNLNPPWTHTGNAYATTPPAQSPIKNSPTDDQGARLYSNSTHVNPNPSITRGITVGSSDTLYVQFDFKAASGALNPHFVLRDGGTWPPDLQFHIRGSSGGPEYRDSSTWNALGTTIADETWYRYTFTVDPENTPGLNTYDLRIQSLASGSVDDTYNNLPFRVDTSTYSFVGFSFNVPQTTVAGLCEIDNVLVTTDPDELNFQTLGVIPEPSTLLIWALGLLGLAWCARRRRTK